MEESTKKKKHRRGRRKKSKENGVFNIILLLCVIVFAVSGFQLIKIGRGYVKGQNEYKRIRELVLEGKGDDNKGTRVDFDRLMGLNSDTVAWIRFQREPSVINYPVVQGKDNQEYLHRTFSGNENTLGTIFVNAYNDSGFCDKNTIIYGHRMKDGSMFRHLEDYKDKTFWEENPYFYIYTPDGYELKYHIFSTGVVEDLSDTYLTQFVSEEEFQNFVDMTKNMAEYDTGIEVKAEDTIVTLSTCTSASDEHRYVVRGVLEKKAKIKGE